MEFYNLFSKLFGIRSNTLFDEITGYNHIKRLFGMMEQSCHQEHITTGETLIAKISKEEDSRLFEDIIGYDHIKRLFRLALDSDSVTHILLVGPPASAKTMFLTSLMHRLKNSHFADGGSSTKAGMIDYLFANSPRYLLLDEIDKTVSQDQAFLLNLMETGIVSETKYGKTRSAQIKTSVFATSNNIKRLSAAIQSRFFIVELKPYTYEQFCEITNKLLSPEKVKGIVDIIANAVWDKSGDIRDCVRIGNMTKSLEDVNFLVKTFL